jgi:hypothetical protein
MIEKRDLRTVEARVPPSGSVAGRLNSMLGPVGLGLERFKETPPGKRIENLENK